MAPSPAPHAGPSAAARVHADDDSDASTQSKHYVDKGNLIAMQKLKLLTTGDHTGVSQTAPGSSGGLVAFGVVGYQTMGWRSWELAMANGDQVGASGGASASWWTGG